MLLKKVAPLLLLTFGASDVYATPGWCFYALRPNCRKVKRELSPPEALETPAPLLEKRSSVPGSDPDATTWELPYLPSWAGLPYSTCGGTTKLCPTGYACACQGAGSSRCLPNALPPNTGCSVYAGPSTVDECLLWWSTTATSFATAFGQCGGVTSSNVNQGWDVRTHCPEEYHCACRNFWYHQCLPTSHTTECPPATDYWACWSGDTYTSPTAVGDACGGHCWTARGFTHKCPGSLKCFTQTGTPFPGGHAGCYTSRPPNGNAQTTPTPLCYPIPYTFEAGVPPPACPTTATPGETVGPWQRCGGTYRNSANVVTTWGPPLHATQCGCGHTCSTHSDGWWAECSPVAGGAGTCVGGGTQTMYGQCGGSLLSPQGYVTWTGPYNCPSGGYCSTNAGGDYAGCMPGGARKRQIADRSLKEERRAGTPAENPSSQVTPSFLFNGQYEQATAAGKARL